MKHILHSKSFYYSYDINKLFLDINIIYKYFLSLIKTYKYYDPDNYYEPTIIYIKNFNSLRYYKTSIYILTK